MALRGRGGGTFVAESPPISSGRRTERLQDQLQPSARPTLGCRGRSNRASGRKPAQGAELGTLDEAIELVAPPPSAPMRTTGTLTCGSTSEWPRQRTHLASLSLRPRFTAKSQRRNGGEGRPSCSERLIRSNEQHRELSDLLRRQPIEAVLLMRQHLEQTSRRLAARDKGAELVCRARPSPGTASSSAPVAVAAPAGAAGVGGTAASGNQDHTTMPQASLLMPGPQLACGGLSPLCERVAPARRLMPWTTLRQRQRRSDVTPGARARQPRMDRSGSASQAGEAATLLVFRQLRY